MKVVNNRRRAAQQVTTFSTTRSKGTDGAHLRAKIGISDLERKHLEMFKTVDNRTEMDVYVAYRCRYNSKHGKVCVETDTPPYLIVEDLVGVGSQGDDDFCLPVYAIQESEWIATFPGFSRWLYSACRYPKVTGDNSITPNVGSSGGNYKEVSSLDTFELYAATFIGTLGEYFRTGNIKYAWNCWRLRWSMTYIMNRSLEKKKHVDVVDLLTWKDTLKNLILKRDASEEDANAYKKFIEDVEPGHYYWMMYNLMIEAPEVVHKSHLMNMDLLLCGLLTQGTLCDEKGVSIGCKYEGIQDNILRMIFERAMKHIPKIDLSECVRMDELVECLHKNAGSGVESSLRYWTFLVKVIGYLLERNYSVNNFCMLMEKLRGGLFELKGVTTFCLLICPDAEKYLCDEVVAEYILGAAGGGKSCVLNAVMLVSKTNTPQLKKLLGRNIERTVKVQRKLDLNLEDDAVVWTTFLESVNCVNAANLVHSGKSGVYKEWIIKLASEGDAVHLELLKAFVAKGMEVSPELLGDRRTRTLILRAAPMDSMVMNYYKGGGKKSKHIENLRSNYGGSMSVSSRLLKDFFCEKISDDQKSDDDEEKVGAIEFIKFEKAREIMEVVLFNMFESVGEICTECPICFETGKIMALHGDIRHGVCEKCVGALNTCPFCRALLIVLESLSGI
ncbi:MAG: hypothetical protein Hyperionvirus9_78 [Hyperionvirus sp.]|uniref:RING-type domain-containing protein n=1 Tax=Hyperionvirus sp. TaxID=2487770 RepID=A0A3G5ABJ0_9VIRU|nr:MAG: hypothetical protein Hyperionvirus9_78 [Hyperionvirus sp.]